MKTLIILAMSLLMMTPKGNPQNAVASPDDFTILSDTTEGGVRTILAKPVMVCPSLIEVKVKDGVFVDVMFTGGCPGNLAAIRKIACGMKVSEFLKKLDGNQCGNRPTSCVDQLCRILKKCGYKAAQ